MKIPPICQGTVQKRFIKRKEPSGWQTYGPYYVWTRKLSGKTFARHLTHDQFKALDKAIKENKKIEKQLTKIRNQSERLLMNSKDAYHVL
ncbi:MAG: DUF6788 family protein [Verrucomicrobiota bacterium]